MKVTKEERTLIEELLNNGMKPDAVAFLVGRGVRTVYYIKAELKRKQPTFFQRLLGSLKGVYAKEANTSRVGAYRRIKV